MLKKSIQSISQTLRRFKALPITLVLMVIMELSVYANVGKTPMGGASYRFVQLQNGQTIEAQAVPGVYRSEEVVARFAGDILTLGYKWDHNKQDAEVKRHLFPASYYLTALLMKEPARTRWLNTFYYKYGKGMNSSQMGVDRRNLDYHVILTRDPIVTPQQPGHWLAEVRAMRFVTNADGRIVTSEKLGFEFTLAAINPKMDAVWQLDPELAPYMEQYWADGLAVVDFVDLGGV
ncbi:MAG: hypothetical protein HC851_15395 [Acaryochloris sp. RU_4_1]|nr:hypothetical protein [Acaryochloris sp. RU_4_1]